MKYYKKLNSIGEIEWLAQADNITEPGAVEITEEEYQALVLKTRNWE